MIDNIEFVLKIVFLVLSIVWAARILILRSDKQIVINPLLIIIGAILSVLPDNDYSIVFMDIDMIYIRIALYILYILVIMFGIYTTNQKALYFYKNEKRL